MSRYEIKALRAAANLDLLTPDEARAAVIHLATLLEQTQDAVGYAYGTALVEARRTSTLTDHDRWRELATRLKEHLADQKEAAEGLASPEIVERVRGERRDHDPTVLARTARDAPFHPEVSSYEGEYSVWLPEFEVYGVGSSLDEARSDLIESVREYAADWHDHLAEAPNHAPRAALVALVDAADNDAELFTLIFGRQ